MEKCSSMIIASSKNELLHIITTEDPSLVCVFCRKSEVDEINLGPMYIFKNEVVLHYYCMVIFSLIVNLFYS